MIATASDTGFNSIMHSEKAPASSARHRNGVTGCPGGVTARTAYRRGARFDPDDVPKLASPFATLFRWKTRRFALQSAETEISRRFDFPRATGAEGPRGCLRTVGRPENGGTSIVDATRAETQKKK